MTPKIQHEKWMQFKRPDHTMDRPHVPGLAALSNTSSGVMHGVAVKLLNISSTCDL